MNICNVFSVERYGEGQRDDGAASLPALSPGRSWLVLNGDFKSFDFLKHAVLDIIKLSDSSETTVESIHSEAEVSWLSMSHTLVV